MKKIRTILTGILLILTLSIFTACGNNNAPADEAGTAAEENTTDTGTNENADAVNDKKDNENVFSLYVSMYRYSWKCTNYTSGRRID